MNTIIKTIIGLCSLALLTPTLVQAQEATLFYAQGHARADSHATVILVSGGHHDQHRGRGHNEHGNGHGYGHHNGHHNGHHDGHHNEHHYDHVSNHHDRHEYRHDTRHDRHDAYRTGHHYNAGPEIERVYVNPRLFR